MPLLFLPDVEALFLWGSEAPPRAVPDLGENGEAWTATILGPDGRLEVEGKRLGLSSTAARLALVPAAELESLPGSIATFTLASKLALDLLSRELVVPTNTRRNGRIEARWAASLAASDDAAKVAALARSMPPSAHAVPIARDGGALVWAPDALLRAYIDALIDAVVRETQGGPGLPVAPKQASGDDWTRRFRVALTGEQRSFDARGFGERSVIDELERWSEPALGARDRLRACFRLEPPAADDAPFSLRFLLQSPDDPSLLVAASEIWKKTKGRGLEKLGRAFRDPEESLLEALGRAARLFPPIAPALEQSHPESVELGPSTAWTFLGDGAAALSEAGFGVIVPAELTAAGRRRLRLRMRVGGASRKVAGVVAGAGRFTSST